VPKPALILAVAVAPEECVLRRLLLKPLRLCSDTRTERRRSEPAPAAAGDRGFLRLDVPTLLAWLRSLLWAQLNPVPGHNPERPEAVTGQPTVLRRRGIPACHGAASLLKNKSLPMLKIIKLQGKRTV